MVNKWLELFFDMDKLRDIPAIFDLEWDIISNGRDKMTDEEQKVIMGLLRHALGRATVEDYTRFKEIVDAVEKTEALLKKPVLEDVKCPECDGPMVSRTGKYGVFWGCKRYPTCNGTRDSMGRSKAERAAEKTSFSDMSEQDNSNDMYRFRR